MATTRNVRHIIYALLCFCTGSFLLMALWHGEMAAFPLFAGWRGHLLHGLIGGVIALAIWHRWQHTHQQRDKMRHRILVLNALRSINQLIFQERNHTELLKNSCNYLTKNRGYYNAWAALLDENGKFVTAVEAGIGPGFDALSEQLNNKILPDCIERSMAQSTLVLTDQPSVDCQNCPLSRNYVNRSGITAPLQYDTKLYGVLTLSVHKHLLVDQEEHTLIQDVAEDIAFGLHAITLEKEREKAEKALKKSEELLIAQDKMASLGRVAAGIAHEVRNPLSGINIYLSTLEKLNTNTENKEKIDQILKQLKSASIKIESTIKRVMDFSKRSIPRFTKLNINQPVQEAIGLTAVTLRKNGIAVELELGKNLPPCFADPNQIEEVILNMLNNAAESMQSRTANKKITLTTVTNKDCIEISVLDTGPGIPVNIRKKIFQPFFTTKHEGTGIGLNLCYRIILDHGGSIRVEYPPGKGAKFVISLPIYREEPAA